MGGFWQRVCEMEGKVRIIILSSYNIKLRIMTVIEKANTSLNIILIRSLINFFKWVKIISGKPKKNDLMLKEGGLIQPNETLFYQQENIQCLKLINQRNCSILVSNMDSTDKRALFFKKTVIMKWKLWKRKIPNDNTY